MELNPDVMVVTGDYSNHAADAGRCLETE